MNVLICLLSAFHILSLIQRKVFVGKGIRRLIYLGIILPAGDYLLRLYAGELWFYSGNLVFHSFIYQGLFWAVFTLLFWVYCRELRIAIRFLFPLVGLAFYYLFSLFSTEVLFFWAPFSAHSIQLGWVNSGYLIPVAFALFLWMIKHWSEMSVKTISRLSLALLVVFTILAGFIWSNARQAVEDLKEEYRALSVYPANSLQTEWNVTLYREGTYFARQYHFVQGWQGKQHLTDAFNNYESAQRFLNHPATKSLYLNGFKNPLLDVEFQNEFSIVTITELTPSIEFLWIKKIEIIYSRSGRIIDTKVQYGTII